MSIVDTRDAGSVVRRAGRSGVGGLGVVGSVVCAASMIAVAVGVGVGGAAAATGMAAMSGTGPDAPGGVLGVLLRIGPALLVVSALLVSAAFALSRRRVAAIPAVLAGVVLYAGMYSQPDLTVMYTAIVVGYLSWGGLYLWVRRTPTHRTQTTPST